MGAVGEHERLRWVVKSPAWGTAFWSGMSLVGLAAGVAMTIASGGRPDTPLIAMGPIAILFGLVCGYLALLSRHGQIAVEGDSYTTRGGVRTKTRTLRMSDAVIVRGGLGNDLAYVVVTDSGGQRFRFSLHQGPLAMHQHVAARLLASGADIDPECSCALRQLAGSAAPDDQPVGGPFVRLDSHGRLRWPRGTWNGFFVAAMFIPAGLFWLFAAAPGVPRGWGLLIVAVGLVSGALPLHGRYIDSKKLDESHR